MHHENNVQAPAEAGETMHHAASDAAATAPFLAFTGTGKSLFFLYIINGLLTVLTLGIYSFWGTTKIRRYFWSHTKVQGEPLEYTGTGGQLFVGFLIGIVLLGLLALIALVTDMLFGPPAGTLTGILIALLFAPYAIFRSMRFRLAHTRLHGIPFGLEGSPVRFAGRTLLRSFIALVTLGLMIPWAYAKVTADILGNIRYGDKMFTFTGKPMALVKAAILPMLLVIVPMAAYVGFLVMLASGSLAGYSSSELRTLILIIASALGLLTFISSLLWQCRFIRWAATGMHFGEAGLTCSITPLRLFVALLKFMLITLFTLGIGLPWAIVGLQRFFMQLYEPTGDIVFADVHRGPEQHEATGDGIAQAFDFDMGF
jgi:uncharacterized membrane protein YjgN (DUF898 family)